MHASFDSMIRTSPGSRLSKKEASIARTRPRMPTRQHLGPCPARSQGPLPAHATSRKKTCCFCPESGRAQVLGGRRKRLRTLTHHLLSKSSARHLTRKFELCRKGVRQPRKKQRKPRTRTAPWWRRGSERRCRCHGHGETAVLTGVQHSRILDFPCRASFPAPSRRSQASGKARKERAPSASPHRSLERRRLERRHR